MTGIYTLGVWRTPNQTDSDVTFSRSCDQGKSQKDLKDVYGRLIDLQGQMPKLFYFNLLDLATFLIHPLFSVSLFDVATLGVR